MRAWKVVFAVILCLLLVAACGGQAALIEKPAGDMNLAAGDLGADYSLTQEQGLDQLKVTMDLPEDEDLKDASFRMFATSDGSGIVIAVVISLNRLVESNELAELRGGFEQGFTSQVPGATLKSMAAPSVGDEASMTGADFPDMGVAMYFLSFRKANVVGVIAVVGTTDIATETYATELGRKMDGKMK